MKDKVQIKKSYYFDDYKNKKRNGIYCPTIDRWLLIDEYDHSVTLETARVLASKIASTVLILPNQEIAMDNDNCLNFTLFDKTVQRKPGGADLFTSQIPVIRTVKRNQIYDLGIPEDYKSSAGIHILQKLKKYAHFVHRCMYAITIVDQNQGSYNNLKFSSDFFPEYQNHFEFYSDQSNFQRGVLQEIKKILYFSNDVDEAFGSIESIWNNQKKIMIIRFAEQFWKVFNEQTDYDFT
jgi:hypothetical protein